MGIDRGSVIWYDVHSMNKGGEEMTGFMSAKEAAETLGYHKYHVYRLLRQGRLDGQRIGGGWVVSVSSVAHIKGLQDGEGRVNWRERE